MTPETMLSQLLTVFYSLVGLPISMLALKTIGEVIVSLVQSFVLRIEKCLFKTRHVYKIRIKTFLVTCLLMILILSNSSNSRGLEFRRRYIHQAPVVQRPDNFIWWIRHYSESKIYFTLNIVQGFRTLSHLAVVGVCIFACRRGNTEIVAQIETVG